MSDLPKHAAPPFSLGRKRLCLASALFVLGVQSNNLAQTQATHRPSRAATPVQRTDANSKLAHEQLVSKSKQGGIDLYFVGDSITRRWGCGDPQWSKLLENWRKNFFGWNAGNFGWGGDSTQNILWRLQNGELDGVHPKVIVVLAGTNNVGNRAGGEQKIADIVEGIQAIISTCRERAPDAKVILMGIFPRNDGMEVMPEIAEINRRISAFADGKTCIFLSINDMLADADGKLLDGMTIDKLHLSEAGYQVWADSLKPILTKLLGKPADTDRAPPPTSDPSISRPAKG